MYECIKYEYLNTDWLSLISSVILVFDSSVMFSYYFFSLKGY